MAGIYVHIPLCATRCIYCDFYSTTSRGVGRALVDALLREADERLAGEGWRRVFDADGGVATLYVGGGTPSQLPVAELCRLLEGLGERFDLSRLEELTVEANPEDVAANAEWSEALVECVRRLSAAREGASPLRVSLGVQSFDDDELRTLRRRHNSHRAVEAVGRLRSAGVENVSIDLMYGLPRQTLASWGRSIDAALALATNHVSAYCLTVEEGTPLSRMLAVQPPPFALPDDETCLAMSSLLGRRLREAGFEHYEISNYARPGRRSRHNMGYWTGRPYMGLGPGAHSYDGRRRRTWNAPDLVAYLRGQRDAGGETLSARDLYNERVMLGLRTADGLPFGEFVARGRAVGQSDVSTKVEELVNDGLLTIGDNRVRLTARGVDVADEVIRSFFCL